MTVSALTCTSFAAATAAATGFTSMPTVPSPRSRAANSVVPRPQNGSSTQSCACASARIPSGNSKGNIVKYGQTAFSRRTTGAGWSAPETVTQLCADTTRAGSLDPEATVTRPPGGTVALQDQTGESERQARSPLAGKGDRSVPVADPATRDPPDLNAADR